MSLLSLVLVAAGLSQGGAAMLTASPEKIRVGDTVTLTLEVSHLPGQRIEVEDSGVQAPLAEAWIPVDGPELERGRERSLARWQWMVLEPCELELPLPEVSLDGVPLEVRAGRLEVQGVLAEGEDSARPAPALLPAPPAPLLRPVHLLVLPAIAGLLLGALLLLRRRRGSHRPPPAEPLQLLDGLQPGGDARVFAGELARLLREAVDRHSGRDLSACTDQEWLALHAESGWLEAPEVASLGPLLARCERTLYGGERLTSLALEEDLRVVRSFLERVASRTVTERASEAPGASDSSHPEEAFVR